MAIAFNDTNIKQIFTFNSIMYCYVMFYNVLKPIGNTCKLLHKKGIL